MPLNAHATFGSISVTSSTVTINTNYVGVPILLNRAAGITATLPAASGSGNEYRFIVGTTVTSNSDIIKVANATDVMCGYALLGQDAADTSVFFEVGATDDTITLNGSTTGGLRGMRVTCTDIASGLWAVEVRGAATGTEATPFSATVA